MKKVVLFSLMLASTFFLNAQIQVNSDGNVGIGTTANSYRKLNVLGSSNFDGPTSYLPALHAVSNNGTQIRSIKVNSIGQGNIVIDAKQLKAGLYLYLLIVDGILVDTKRMVLTD